MGDAPPVSQMVEDAPNKAAHTASYAVEGVITLAGAVIQSYWHGAAFAEELP